MAEKCGTLCDVLKRFRWTHADDLSLPNSDLTNTRSRSHWPKNGEFCYLHEEGKNLNNYSYLVLVFSLEEAISLTNLVRSTYPLIK